MLKIAGITVLVTVVAVLTLLAMYGAYRGVDGWIARNKEDACLEQAIRNTLNRAAREGHIDRRDVDIYVDRNLLLTGRDVNLVLYEHCRER